ncbi:hypothetical protein [Haloarchaeobius baliensis]|uniref:hypothetical protein n=1 Tax=Haloarchaeobius baliensis TaxID=1670458 RepID=UPI003F884504
MRELHRVLKPGGVFAFNSHNWRYVLPALLTDPGYIREYYLSNGNLRRLLSPYKRDASELDLDVYRGSPRRTRRQLEAAGFDEIEVLARRDGLLGQFEIQHHYVAERA